MSKYSISTISKFEALQTTQNTQILSRGLRDDHSKNIVLNAELRPSAAKYIMIIATNSPKVILMVTNIVCIIIAYCYKPLELEKVPSEGS